MKYPTKNKDTILNKNKARQLDQHLAIINQDSHRSIHTPLSTYTFQYPLQENKQYYEADTSNKPQCFTEEATIASYRPETGTSLRNGVKIINNVELQHEMALNNIDKHESLLL